MKSIDKGINLPEAGLIGALIDAGSYLYLDVNGGRNLPQIARMRWHDERQLNEVIALLEQAGCAAEGGDDKLDAADFSFHFEGK
jgi:hypothetical protein